MKNSRQSYANLVLATLAFAAAFAVWNLLPPLAKQIQQELKLDNFSISALIAIPVLLGSLARIPLGIITDGVGGRKVFTTLLAFCLLPVAALGFANAFWSYAVVGFFLGLAGASFAVGVPFVSRWFSADKQGLATGIYGLGTIGPAIAAFAVPPLALAFGGRQMAYWAFLIPTALMAVVFWTFARDAPGKRSPQSIGNSLAIMRNEPLIWTLSLFYFITFGGFVALNTYLPKLLGEWLQLDATGASQRTAGFTIVAVLARPIGGWISDRLGGATVLTWVFLLGPLGALGLSWQAAGSPDMLVVTGLFLATAIGMGLGNGAVLKLVAQYFPRNTGLATGVVGCAGGLGGFFPPLAMGWVKDGTGNYSLGFALLASLVVASLVVLLVMRRRDPQEHSGTLMRTEA